MDAVVWLIEHNSMRTCLLPLILSTDNMCCEATVWWGYGMSLELQMTRGQLLHSLIKLPYPLPLCKYLARVSEKYHGTHASITFIDLWKLSHLTILNCSLSLEQAFYLCVPFGWSMLSSLLVTVARLVGLNYLLGMLFPPLCVEVLHKLKGDSLSDAYGRLLVLYVLCFLLPLETFSSQSLQVAFKSSVHKSTTKLDS